jgi:hypothetical protein
MRMHELGDSFNMAETRRFVSDLTTRTDVNAHLEGQVSSGVLSRHYG